MMSKANKHIVSGIFFLLICIALGSILYFVFTKNWTDTQQQDLVTTKPAGGLIEQPIQGVDVSDTTNPKLPLIFNGQWGADRENCLGLDYIGPLTITSSRFDDYESPAIIEAVKVSADNLSAVITIGPDPKLPIEFYDNTVSLDISDRGKKLLLYNNGSKRELVNCSSFDDDNAHAQSSNQSDKEYNPSDDGYERGTCMLTVNSEQIIDGNCWYNLFDDGSFNILDNKYEYIATLLIQDSGIGEAYWNEQPQSKHAHASLGKMKKNGACWSNEIHEICAWK